MTITRQNFSTIYTCFPGGKHKVLTMSYDDGKIYDRRLVALFNQYGIRGTFHINGNGLFGEMGPLPRIPFEEIKELYKGHEVSCHTYTHPTIERCLRLSGAGHELSKRFLQQRNHTDASGLRHRVQPYRRQYGRFRLSGELSGMESDLSS